MNHAPSRRERDETPPSSAPAKDLAFAQFRIARLERCDYGAKQAKFVLEVAGFGRINGELFVPMDGRSTFVRCEAVKCQFQYVRPCEFSDVFAASALESVLERIAAEEHEA